ncbi:MAG: hypothetical protein A3F82_05595 [Deltaproteobacteria bacterium RIFCSPLOWO2_12_FULL_44_12]|nr:MAG: hypothetical protein A2712_01710 [Deltaproteobacteria bacterium RIFCSPHIGHO2_01_FULL_43_49]OGQ15156.1 MAG: hypothetical protein A3D22_03765 [Deltaproteobacteria bacterium RIFCSPHIGHO2_02_FULL_44_53]OGQ27223.1 MAG: hypothetical protein A3D98_02305 [Deltaproteobacteria bacterium RIFCSPHIGHO2_12_FULL_44_21]OGQ42873.1 MAG: hypothetical protein A3I70_07230 [Deltaproteobacteria bacterium RIFCSPLOWO2_02_FULL_44_34]OGQ69910.1 MAG: hypothetical protein A3F82_05595 [Deltaproteobacteria bacterium 
MKILLIIGVALGLGMSAQAADSYIAKFKPGKWEGKVVNSVSPDLKGKKFTGMTEVKGDEVIVTVVMEGAKGGEKEVWKITPTKLVQTEYDAAGKSVATYTANAKKGGTDAEKTFEINCADRAAKKCDNNIDPNNTWTLKTEGQKFTYLVRGVKDKKEVNSPVVDRHLFQFNYAVK